MRRELEQIQQIENYLLQKMTSDEKLAFEAELAQSQTLQQYTTVQSELMQGIKRIGLKKRIKKVRRKYHYRKWMIRVSISLIIIVLVAGLYHFSKTTENNSEANFNPEKIEVGHNSNEISIPEEDTLSCKSNQYLHQQLFEINTNNDTVVESEDGIVVFIPANAFDTDEEQIDFLIQEAISPEDILYAGLNTITDEGDELETGGMFYFDAFANGERVDLNKDLVVDIPATEDKKEMSLYDGVQNEKNELVWTNPKELTRPLTPVEITSLDFYPPGYENKMEEWGYLNKKFKDSLYYSFIPECPEDDFIIIEEEVPEVKNNEQRLSNSIRTGNPMLMLMAIPQDEAAVMPSNVDDVIQWNFEVEYSGPYADIIMTVDQKDGWHIYSQMQPDGAIPLPTTFKYNINRNYELVGDTEESIASIFEYQGFPERSFRRDQVRFVQRIQRKSSENFKLKIDYEYMACKTACLPPEFRQIELNIKGYYGVEEVCDCGVDPSAVKAIWNKKFNNTNLATKEFEMRMPWIHQSCNTTVLELYVNNLDKDLSEIDLIAAQKTSGSVKQKFLELAELGHGKVDVSSRASKRLNDYYALKKKALHEAVKRMQVDYWKKQTELDSVMNDYNSEANKRERENKKVLDKQEIEFNTERVYRELGMKRPAPPRPNPINFGQNSYWATTVNRASPGVPIRPNRPVFRGTVSSLGWKNVDCLMNVSLNRESAKIRGYHGRRTEIKYTPFDLTIENHGDYKNVNVYVVPLAFNSYIKVKQRNGAYRYQLNDALQYKTFIIAWTEEEFFFYQNAARGRIIDAELKPVSKAEFDRTIKTELKAVNNMEDELNYLEFVRKDEDRQNRNKSLRNLKKRAKPYVFPCNCDRSNGRKLLPNETVTNLSDDQSNVNEFEH